MCTKVVFFVHTLTRASAIYATLACARRHWCIVLPVHVPVHVPVPVYVPVYVPVSVYSHVQSTVYSVVMCNAHSTVYSVNCLVV